MAYKRRSPMPVVEGGTGDQSLTSYAVLCGGTTPTNPIQSIAGVGTLGQVLTSNGAAALPTFQAPAASSISITGDSGSALTGNSFTFTGGTTGLTFAGATTTETLGGTLAIAHGGTNATSMATTDGTVYFDGTRLVTTATGTTGQALVSAGAGVAPAYGTLPIAGGGTNATSMATTDGVVYYDGTRLVTTSAGTAGQVLTSNGAGVAPTYQASGAMTTQFSAYLTADATNATGDGTFVNPLIFDATIFNNGSGYNTGTGNFTAPATGLYYFTVNIFLANLGAAHTAFELFVNTTANQLFSFQCNPFAMAMASIAAGQLVVNASYLASMTASDTAFISLAVFSSTKTVTLKGNNTGTPLPIYCSFSGFRVA